jgi:cytochrome P450
MFGAAEDSFERVLLEDTLICGIPLKKGTLLNTFVRPLLSNPHIFKDPQNFNPDRWQD